MQMDYLLRCFGRRKDRSRRRSPKTTSPLNSSHQRHKPPSARSSPGRSRENLSLKQEIAGGGGSPPALRENHEKAIPVCGKKKVTFDLNVQTYEAVVNDDDPKHSVDVVDGCTVQEKELAKAVDKLKPSSSSFPLNHRYQHCENVDEEGVGDEEEDEPSDFGSVEKDDQAGIEEDEEASNDSFFPLSDKKGRGTFDEVSSPKMMCMSFNDKQPTISAKSHVHDQGQYVHSVLNSVENISMCKEFKVHAGSTKNTQKENINSELNNEMVSNSRPALGVKKPEKSANSKLTPNLSSKQEMSLDASLSKWLVSDDSTMEKPQECYSHHSHYSLSREEQPILGALTVEDIKQSSYASSSRKSLNKNPDEIPILGTVGRYWNFQNQVGDAASYDQCI